MLGSLSHPREPRHADRDRRQSREKEARRERARAVHGGQPAAHAEYAMIAAACGFDAVYIDLEHNPTSLETAAAVCVAALGMGITPIARVTSHDPHDATRILDCGAQGVMVPHVQNAAEARAIVEACLYAPKGHRSAFGSGPALGYAALGQAEVCRRLNDETLLMAMIETPDAVANAEAIAAVEGIDVLHIGASDL